MIDTVTINGAALNPCMVLAAVTVVHGRKGFGEGSVPSSATVTVKQQAGSMPVWRSGDTFTLDGPDGRMFAGRVVEYSLTHVDDRGTRIGLFTVTAAGPVAALGVRKIGDVPWPQETGTQRATRILAAAGTPWRVDGTVDLTVLARDVDAQPAAGLLDDLAADTSAAVFDTPTGEVVYQALSGRNRPVVPFMWDDFDAALTWDDFDAALTWDGDSPSIGDWPSPTSQFPVVLPCDAVGWEPEWSTSEASIINDVSIGYGTADPQAVIALEDAASIARHGRRYLHQGTQLAGLADAQTRAAHIITTQAVERWALDDITVLLDLLDAGTRAKVLGLVCGDHVVVQGMPQPAPAIDWTGIVEGWTYTQTAAGGRFQEQLTVTLSDPLHSLAVMRWDDYPATYLWNQHPGHLTWDELETVDILEAA